MAADMPNLNSHTGKVRALGMLEGISFLFLLGVAMPLKYMANLPEMVRWTGWVHGGLFLVYCYVVLMALINGALPFWKSVVAFLAALIPFGPFLVDRRLAEDEAREVGATSAE